MSMLHGALPGALKENIDDETDEAEKEKLKKQRQAIKMLSANALGRASSLPPRACTIRASKTCSTMPIGRLGSRTTLLGRPSVQGEGPFLIVAKA